MLYLIRVVLAVLAATVCVSCISLDPEERRANSAARKLAELSTADVLVPLDERFRKTWELQVVDSRDNYSYSANAQVSFHPDKIPELSTGGSLVNDMSTWLREGSRAGYGAEYVEDLQRAALADSRAPIISTACGIGISEPIVVVCEYDVAGQKAGLAVRRFDDHKTVMVSDFANAASLTLMASEFEIVSFEKAAERWLVSPH